jgi:hypothetical protein
MRPTAITTAGTTAHTTADTTASDTPPTPVGAIVDRFFEAITAGRGGDLADIYADDAELDATVPNWRFSKTGSDAIGAEFARSFAHPGRLEESDRRETADGVVITYLLTWEQDGVPHAAHHCHVLTIDPTISGGRIVADKMWCGGRWPAALLAEMEAAHGG